jgi:hypothetical protein
LSLAPTAAVAGMAAQKMHMVYSFTDSSHIIQRVGANIPYTLTKPK